MPVIRAFDVVGTGFNFQDGSGLASYLANGTFVNALPLGDNRFVEYYTVDSGGVIDNYSGIVDYGSGVPVIEQIVYFAGTTRAAEITNIFQSVAGIASGGLSFLLSGDDTVTGNRYTDRINGFAGHDVLNGLRGHDVLSGDGGNDTLRGGEGNDVIDGGLGRDTIIGGLGRDDLRGGDDRNTDTFVFLSVLDSKSGGNRDVISDFDRTRDVIQFDGIDANINKRGFQDFEGFSGRTPTAHHVWFKPTADGIFLRADVNGDKTADMEILLVNVISISSDDLVIL